MPSNRQVHRWMVADVWVQISLLGLCCALCYLFLRLPYDYPSDLQRKGWVLCSVVFVLWQLASAAVWSRQPQKMVGRRWIALLSWFLILSIGFATILVWEFVLERWVARYLEFFASDSAGPWFVMTIIGQPLWSITYIAYCLHYQRLFRRKYLGVVVVDTYFTRADILDR